VEVISDAEARVLDAIVERDVAELLVEIVRVPSITGTDAESELQHWAAAQLHAADMATDVWKLDLDALRADPRFPGTEAPRVEGYGVVGLTRARGSGNAPSPAPSSVGGDDVPALILQGHVDVVPTGDVAKWNGADPFSASIDGDVLHGRGACDMKGGLAAALIAVRALHAASIELVRPLAVHTVVSEEDGGLGAFATLVRGHTGDCAIIPEPTSGKVVVANAGALTFRLTVHGRAAHGSVRHEGVSAIEALYPLLRAIDDLEARRNRSGDALFAGVAVPYPISVGTVHAGDWPSSVPDLLVAEGRMGVVIGEDPDDARRQLEVAIDDAAARDSWLRDNPPLVEWVGGQFASGRLPPAHPLLAEVLSAAVDAHGGDRAAPLLGAGSWGSDLRLYVGIGGIAALHYGPGDVRHAHAPREQVAISDVAHTARTLALVAMRRCGVHGVGAVSPG
jgi:acetylornithine deacetylase